MQFPGMKQQPLLHLLPACGQLTCCESSRCPRSLPAGAPTGLASSIWAGWSNGWSHRGLSMAPFTQQVDSQNQSAADCKYSKKASSPTPLHTDRETEVRKEEVCPSLQRQLGSRTPDSTPWTHSRAPCINILPGTKP